MAIPEIFKTTSHPRRHRSCQRRADDHEPGHALFAQQQHHHQQQDADNEQEQRQRRREEGVWEAREFLESFVRSRWDDHWAYVTLACSLTMDEVRELGSLDQSEGVCACRRLVNVAVINEEIGAALWERLAADMRRSVDNNSRDSGKGKGKSKCEVMTKKEKSKRKAQEGSGLESTRCVVCPEGRPHPPHPPQIITPGMRRHSEPVNHQSRRESFFTRFRRHSLASGSSSAVAFAVRKLRANNTAAAAELPDSPRETFWQPAERACSLAINRTEPEEPPRPDTATAQPRHSMPEMPRGRQQNRATVAAAAAADEEYQSAVAPRSPSVRSIPASVRSLPARMRQKLGLRPTRYGAEIKNNVRAWC